jgi:predicted ribosomally synthesized peptide with nif11-like leader
MCAMSWSELERLVEDAESQRELQRSLRHCRSRKELILAARRLGYRITRIDLQRAWQEEQAEAEGQQQAGG